MFKLLKQKQQKTPNIREFLPEIVYLETEDFEEAKKISDMFPNPDQKWQIYINSLAYFGFTKWVKSRLDNMSINAYDCSLFKNLPEYRENIDMIYNLRVGDFKVCLIPVESLTKSGINIPISLLNSPKFAAHFYVLVEVLEEEKQVIIRGLIRHDQVMKNIPFFNVRSSVNLSVFAFDPEPNNLLAYLQYLSPDAIALPTDDIVNLRDWLLGQFGENWEAIGCRTRNLQRERIEERIEGRKVLEFEKTGEKIGFIMNIPSNNNFNQENEIKINVRLCAIDKPDLPLGTKVIILDEENIPFMEEIVKTQDIIYFTVEPGDHFSVKITVGDDSIIEAFVI